MSTQTNEVNDRYNTRADFRIFRSEIEKNCKERFGIEPSIRLVRLAYDFEKTTNFDFAVKDGCLCMVLGVPKISTPKCNAA